VHRCQSSKEEGQKVASMDDDKNARWLEALGYLTIQLGYVLKTGTEIGFKLIH